MATSAASFPVNTKQLKVSIQGHETDLVLSSYEDRIMVIVTQIGTMGTMLLAKRVSMPLALAAEHAISGTEPLLTACARQLAELMSKGGVTRPLFLSLGLHDHSTATLKEIIEVVLANKAW
eukprot:jgi/Mesen1/9417/ME000614S08663